MKAHRTDGVSLAFSLIFLAVAAWWLLAQIIDLALPAVGWFLAGLLILLGLAGVVGALLSGRAGTSPNAEEAPEPAGAVSLDPAGGSVYEPATESVDPVTMPPYEPLRDAPVDPTTPPGTTGGAGQQH
jgi:hypothetical protein